MADYTVKRFGWPGSGRTPRAPKELTGAAPTAQVHRRPRSRRALRAQSNGKRLELVREPRLDVLRCVGDLHRGEPRERLLDQDPQLEARKRGTQAEVPAPGAECLVLGVARDLELVGILVARLVAV